MSEFIEKYGTDDPRLGHIITNGTDGKIVLMGFPYDEGVKRNGGRVGAKEGPKYVRSFLPKMGTIFNPEYKVDLTNIRISDAGDIDPNLTLEEAHEKLAERVESLIKSGKIPFVIGGGNDQSYPNALGMIKATKGSVGVVNIDAHLDVRPLKDGKVHSGSPFRLLLENEMFQERNGTFVEFAVQGHQCSNEHWEYITGKDRCNIIPLSYLRDDRNVEHEFLKLLETMGDNIFVSFDIDSIISSECPGVSCPANIGLSAQEACLIAYQAGKNKNVKLMDISEYNPKVEDYVTGRLVVMLFYYFLMGYACRGAFTKEMDEHFAMGEGHFLY